jgi:hypothetical protein
VKIPVEADPQPEPPPNFTPYEQSIFHGKKPRKRR